MAGELMQKRPHWWPSVADWFETFPFDLRSAGDEHMIAVEEFREDGVFVVKAGGRGRTTSPRHRTRAY